MGRLIEANSLRDRASEYALSNDEYERFCKIIEAEPTAYDVDAVVKELKQWTFEADVIMPLGDTMKNRRLIASGNAIDIVREGGAE